MHHVKTTASGAVAGVCQLADFLFPGLSVVCVPLSALAMALMGWFAADRH